MMDQLDFRAAKEIGANLPFLRRYSRLLTGNQTSGDQSSLAALEANLTGVVSYDSLLFPKVALFRAFHEIWSPSVPAPGETADGAGHLSRLRTSVTRPSQSSYFSQAN
ncbi:hypothetical protein PNH50_18920 (plasmid) [Leisingera aquaemixtae]|uniref:hypothetical protein n=1 Tax=Leisingera aquaemixtae TaxID=1396826 RepID=UPI003984589C